MKPTLSVRLWTQLIVILSTLFTQLRSVLIYHLERNSTFLFRFSIFKVNSKVLKNLDNSSNFIVVMSFASSIVVTFKLKREGRDLKTFQTSLVAKIFSPRAKDSFAKLRTQTLNSAMDSSSTILKASNFDAKICNRDIFTLDVPS